MKLIIGLTGGIGSGKSTVANEFKALGVEVVDADDIARQVVEPGQNALHEIELFFGKEVINENGALDRAKLRKIVFQCHEKKQWLNDLLHPLIRESMLSKIAAVTSDYVILEAPLLFENQLNQYTNYNIVVDVSEKNQIQRATKRDGNSEAQIRAIMNSQLSRKDRLAKADYVIDNNSADLMALKHHIKLLHLQFLSLLK
jgi:dephospho-CoA kinase